jgi:hypothetical protein
MELNLLNVVHEHFSKSIEVMAIGTAGFLGVE